VLAMRFKAQLLQVLPQAPFQQRAALVAAQGSSACSVPGTASPSAATSPMWSG